MNVPSSKTVRFLFIRRLTQILSACALTTIVACHSSSTTPPPTREDIEKALKAMHEKPAQPGLDGAVTVEIKSVTIGASRKWHYDDGGDGTPDTDLWSARVHLLIRTHYRTRTLVWDWDEPYAVFRNGLGEWQVGITSGAKQEKSYDDPPDMK